MREITITRLDNGWLFNVSDCWSGGYFTTTDPMDGLRRILEAYEKSFDDHAGKIIIETPKLKSE